MSTILQRRQRALRPFNRPQLERILSQVGREHLWRVENIEALRLDIISDWDRCREHILVEYEALIRQ